MEADVGPVLVAADDARIVEAVTAAGGRATLTRPDHGSGSDRIFEALTAVDPDGRHDVIVNVQGDLPTIARQAVRAAVGAARRPGRRHRDAGDRNPPRRGARRPQRRQGGGQRSRARPAARALFHPRSRAVGRGAAAAPHRPLRLPPRRARSASSPCRLRRSSGASGSSNCGRWRRACASTSRSSTSPRSASTRREDLRARAAKCWRRKERHDRQDHRLSGRTGRQFAHRLPSTPIPIIEPLPCADLRGRVRRAAGRRGRSRHDPDREFDRRPGRRHPRICCRPRGLHIVAEMFPADPVSSCSPRRARRSRPAQPSTATSMRSASAARSSASSA